MPQNIAEFAPDPSHTGDKNLHYVLMRPAKSNSGAEVTSSNDGQEATMLTRDQLLRELQSRGGNLSTLVLVYLLIVGAMLGSAYLIL